MAYDYYENVRNDVEDYIRKKVSRKEEIIQNWARLEFLDKLREELEQNSYAVRVQKFKYLVSKHVAEENLCHNGELLVDALYQFGMSRDIAELDAQACDSLIRKYLLPEIIDDCLDDIYGLNPYE